MMVVDRRGTIMPSSQEDNDDEGNGDSDNVSSKNTYMHFCDNLSMMSKSMEVQTS